MAGFFITFEGVEGCGKSTQVTLLAQALRARDYEVVSTREPGGTPIGQTLRRILLESASPSLARGTELLLLLADRAQHVHDVIAPGLQDGKVVISDRFLDSTTAYQGYGRGIDREFLDRLNVFACDGYLPALTILLDLPVEHGLERAAQRRGTTAAADHFEAESLAFHERVRAGFLAVARAEPKRVCVFDARRSIAELHQEILTLVCSRLAHEMGNDL
ncbi:MAG TPA: dTMP kinase [Methylomirabilota bacterium]|jgi:dTMP kinase|nr:dTMP kinase [Methylomirabilota bacterium]